VDVFWCDRQRKGFAGAVAAAALFYDHQFGVGLGREVGERAGAFDDADGDAELGAFGVDPQVLGT